jgi:hypothetical protein
MDRDPPRPRSIDPAISQHLELIVQRAMAKEPADRYPDAMALKHALDLFANPEGSEMLPARAAQPTSPFSVDREAAQVQNARPRLVVTMVLAAAFVTALLAMALVSIGVLTGWLTFRPVEMALLFGSALGTSLTPGIILVRRLRRVVWNNTARVLDATERVAVPFMAGLLGYGTANLVVRFGDMVLVRFADARLFGHPSGIAWPGWDLVFPVVGGIWSGVVWVRHAVLGEMAGTWRRRLIGPALYAAGLSLAASAVYGGLTWRASSALPTAVAPDVPIAAGHPMPAPEPSHHAASATSHTQVPRASRDELAAGVTAGLDALVALSQKYPDDPDVLQSLVFAYAARSTRHLDAIQAAKSLFRISPEKVDDADLRVLITSVAKTSKTASEAAIQLMASDMGASGPDLLYDVMLSRTTASAQAENALATAAVQARFSPALRIAYELRNASSCAARLPLLERASLLGDARSIGILDPLSKHTRRGCGKWRNRPCAPPCVKEAERYRNAIGKISARIRREQ